MIEIFLNVILFDWVAETAILYPNEELTIVIFLIAMLLEDSNDINA